MREGTAHAWRRNISSTRLHLFRPAPSLPLPLTPHLTTVRAETQDDTQSMTVLHRREGQRVNSRAAGARADSPMSDDEAIRISTSSWREEDGHSATRCSVNREECSQRSECCVHGVCVCVCSRSSIDRHFRLSPSLSHHSATHISPSHLIRHISLLTQ